MNEKQLQRLQELFKILQEKSNYGFTANQESISKSYEFAMAYKDIVQVLDSVIAIDTCPESCDIFWEYGTESLEKLKNL